MTSASEFIVSVFANASTSETPAQITPEEAAYNIAEWIAEGIEVPDSITPALFSEIWNSYCEK